MDVITDARAIYIPRDQRLTADPNSTEDIVDSPLNNRQALLEALYVDEVEEVCRSAAELEGADPWEALNAWFERLIGYIATKRALADELLNYLDHDAPLFKVCRVSLFAAGEPLLKRAQDAGVVRADVEFSEVMQMLMGILKIPAEDPEQIKRLLRIALDGLRYNAGG